MASSDIWNDYDIEKFDFRVLVSNQFQKSMEKTNDPTMRQKVIKCMRNLSFGRECWKRCKVKKIKTNAPDRSIRTARIDNNYRIMFEAPIRSRRYDKPVIFIHDFCGHDEYIRKLNNISGMEYNEDNYKDFELEITEDEDTYAKLNEDITAFAKPIPPKAFSNLDKIDEILKSEKANIFRTQKQMELLDANPPMLIHGHAGSGKTTILCHRLALSVIDQRNHNSLDKIVYISYNDRLVKQAEKDVKEILSDLHLTSNNLEGVSFIPFQKFLKNYVGNPDRFNSDSYVSYGRFKYYYNIFRRGNPSARKVSPELAWHGIRSILKGACIPPEQPPLSKKNYEAMARRRREFREDLFEDIYTIGLWYQKEIIRERKLWDDQDLAWTAINWIMNEQRENPFMRLYSEIFCDEVQDLTEIEFLILISLCRPPIKYAEEGMKLFLSGDPLQTINPTGFRWAVLGKEIYKVEGKSVQIHELEENFRSDKRIVNFANQIQKIRSFYMNQKFKPQRSFEKDGDIPQIINIETDDEINLISNKIGNLPPESAVIIWDEDDEDVEKICESDKVLYSIDKKLDLYKVTEAKGLEFRLVILYKFGSHPEVIKWIEYIKENKKPSVQDEIPLLYFLNRLYVSITRAKNYIIIIDTPTALESLWSIWSDILEMVDRNDLVAHLDTHPSLLGDMSPDGWKKWADSLFEKAERDGDIRNFERSRRAYEKANQDKDITKVDARIAEIQEDWGEAGKLYFDIKNYMQSGNCYEKDGNWKEAIKAYSRLPSTPEINRKLAICGFNANVKENKNEAAKVFYEHVQKNKYIEIKYLQELVEILLEGKELTKAAIIFERIGDDSGNRESYVQAAKCKIELKNYDEALDLFTKGGMKYGREYNICKAEKFLNEGGILKAVKIFSENNEHRRVISISMERENNELDKYKADSHYRLKNYTEALELYEKLENIAIENKDVVEQNAIMKKIGLCLKQLGRKREAYSYFKKCRDYENAIITARELKIPLEQINLLRIEEARMKGDFKLAIKYAEEIGDDKLVFALYGHENKYEKKYKEALEYFVMAEDWNEALDCIDKSAFTGEDWWNANVTCVKALSKIKRELTKEEKDKFIQRIRSLQEDEIWDQYISREDMGKAYEKCGSFVETSLYYDANISEQWAREGWLRVKETQNEYHVSKYEFDKANNIKKRIDQRRKEWSL